MTRLPVSRWMAPFWISGIVAGALWVQYSAPIAGAENRGEGQGAKPWCIAHAVYSEKAADISEHTGNARATDFKPDGTAMYVVGRQTQNVAEYTLSRPWDVSSARFARDLKINAPAAHGLFFNKTNGVDMYVFNRREILQYRLAAPWNIATAKLVKKKVMHCKHARLVRGHDIHFRADGTQFYVEDRLNQAVYQYSLSTPWDVETLQWEYTLDISDQQKAVRGIELAPDGTRLWLMDTGRGEALEYHFGTPWALASATFKRALDVSAISSNSRSITWHPDGCAFYVTSTGHRKVYQFTIPVPDKRPEKTAASKSP